MELAAENLIVWHGWLIRLGGEAGSFAYKRVDEAASFVERATGFPHSYPHSAIQPSRERLHWSAVPLTMMLERGECSPQTDRASQ